jgi:DNA-binding transcriptional LysR family regulator
MLLKHLQYLTALARERHFARAASACAVTQPTLSAGIKQLEDQLGLLIVKRGHRFVGFTAEGEQVLVWAQRITGDAESLEQEASRLRQVLVGRLRIGVVPTALPAVPILASPMATRFPGVKLTVISDPSVDIQAGLDEFRFEAGITYLDNEPLSRVRSLPLYREQYFLITPADGSLAGRAAVSWQEAATLPLCLLTPDMQNRRIVNAHFAAAGTTVQPALETNSVFTLCALVRSGYWSSVLPHGFLPLLSGNDGVAIVELEGPPAPHTVGVVVPDRDPLQPTVVALLDLLRGLDWSTVAAPLTTV